MARSHFSYEKRRKELDKKAKKEAKRQAKLDRKAQAVEDGTVGSGPEIAPLDDADSDEDATSPTDTADVADNAADTAAADADKTP